MHARAGDFELAGQEFLQAFQEDARAQYLVEAARAFEKAGDSVQAVILYTRYLESDPGGAAVQEARAHRARLQAELIAERELALRGARAHEADSYAGAAIVLRTEGKFAEAAAQFELAYQASLDVEYLFLEAEVLLRGRQHADARALYARYLREAPEGVHAERARSRQGELASLERRAQQDAERARQSAPAADAVDESADHGAGLRRWGMVTGGLGLLTLGVSAGLYLRASSLEDAGQGTSSAANARDARRHAYGVAGAGGALVLVGVVLYVKGESASDDDRGVTLVPAIGPESAGLGLWGRF